MAEKTKEKKGTETLAYKQSVLDGLVTTIELLQRPLAHSEQEQVEALEYGLTFRLGELVNECKLREIDLKIEQMRQVIALLKNNVYNL